MPLTLARMPVDCDYAVFEIGMNHPDEVRPLAKMVRPHVAIVTLIAAAHLGFFRNLDEIAKAKAEIFEGLEPDGAVLLNRDDPRWSRLNLPAGPYNIKVKRMSCQSASDYFREFLNHPDGKLPRGWKLFVKKAKFKNSNMNIAFRVSKAS